MLRSGSDTAAAVSRARLHAHVKADQTYTRSVRGYSAKLDRAQRAALLADPSVRAIVPDGVVQLTQTVPTGVARVGGRLSDIAAIDGTDHRVDADVAIVDTGISYHPDLNVAGGYNCSTADHAAWRDRNNHGTHVAGTIGALDNGIGVVGVAPGARVWGVKILNDDGYGLISWYICGLDWILAQRDPADASRPLFEAVNMSVTKPGSDDHNCGFTNNDPLHQAICRVVAGGITVVAAAANDHHNALEEHPRQLRRGHHRLGPCRHGRQGRRRRRQPLLLVGHVRQGRHVRELQQLRRRRRHHRAGQMHHVDDPGREVRLHVRDLDGVPDRGRRRGALQGEPPERDAGRGPRGAALPGQPPLGDVDRPRPVARAAPRRVEDPHARDLRLRPLPRRSHGPSKPARPPRSRSRSRAAARSSSVSGCRSRRCRTAGPAARPRPA